MKTIAYLRKSTDDQPNTLEVQRDAIRRFLGHDPDQAYIERISGGAPLEKREVLLEAIDALGKGDTLVIWKHDRVARSTLNSAMVGAMVEKRGAVLRSTDGVGNDDTPESKLLLDMQRAIAEYERALIRLRTKAALAAKRRRGEKTGGSRPYGFNVMGGYEGEPLWLQEKPSEQDVIKRMAMMREMGQSYRQIAETLTGLNIPGPSGGLWHGKTVNRILNRSSA